MTDWPHAPKHMLSEKGTYMVTAATYKKVLHFSDPVRLQLLHDTLLQLAKKHDWHLQAWAVFANHYHFIADSPDRAETLSAFLSELHVATAKHVNQEDGTPHRKVWWQYWDSRLTHHYSYLARLNYVNQNPVRHGLVGCATDYSWCSARWFETTAPTSFRKTVASFKIDKINVLDDF